MLGLQDIMATAACAATRGRVSHARAFIHSALTAGIWAARHRCILPLPVLLDAHMLAQYPEMTVAYRIPQPQYTQAIREYDDWMCDGFSRLLKRLAPAHPQISDASDRSVGLHWLPLMMRLWQTQPPAATNRNGHHAPTWANCYDQLRRDTSRLDAIHQLWRGDRSSQSRLWPWWKQKLPSPANLTSSALWSGFRDGIGAEQLHERFDHAAGCMYLAAADYQLLADQARRIEQLTRRSQDLQFQRHVTTPEEENPFQGSIGLAILSREPWESVYSAWINHEVSRRNAPPETRPPRTVCIRLGWACGYESLKPWRREPIGPGRNDGWFANRASVAQALTAILLDDWREILQGLPVEFHLERMCPGGRHTCVGKAGPAWKKPARAGLGTPPPHAIGLLFDRLTYLDVAAASDHTPRLQLSDDLAPRSIDWCVVTRADMADWGFTEHCQVKDLPMWTAPGHVVPDSLSHLVVLDDDGQEQDASHPGGWLYELLHQGKDKPVKAKPLPMFRLRRNDPQHSLLDLRTAAVDLLLDLLAQKMS